MLPAHAPQTKCFSSKNLSNSCLCLVTRCKPLTYEIQDFANEYACSIATVLLTAHCRLWHTRLHLPSVYSVAYVFVQLHGYKGKKNNEKNINFFLKMFGSSADFLPDAGQVSDLRKCRTIRHFPDRSPAHLSNPACTISQGTGRITSYMVNLVYHESAIYNIFLHPNQLLRFSQFLRQKLSMQLHSTIRTREYGIVVYGNCLILVLFGK